jgi:hypothetical protein
MINFFKQYELGRYLILAIILLLLGITGGILTVVYHNDTPSLWVGLATSLAFIGMAVFICVDLYLSIKTEWHNVIQHGDHYLVRLADDLTLEELGSGGFLYSILPWKDPVEYVCKKLESQIEVDRSKLGFYLVTIKKEVFYKLGSIKVRAKGLSFNNKCDIQVDSPDIMRDLISHELAHVILESIGYEKDSEECHHDLMQKAGIN